MGKVPEGRKGTGAPNYPRRTLAEPERSLNPNRMVTGAPEGFWIVHLFGFGGWDDEGAGGGGAHHEGGVDRKSTRLNSSHVAISYAVVCLQKINKDRHTHPDSVVS